MTLKQGGGAAWQPALITVAALGVFIWQGVFKDEAQPTVIGGVIALLGLPAAIQADRARRALAAARKELKRDDQDPEDSA